MADTIILYGVSASPFVRKAMAFAAQKAIDFEHVPVLFHSDDPGFVAASPVGKIPALRRGAFTLADSAAICAYLDRLVAAPALIPTEARAAGRCAWFESFGTELFGPIGTAFFELFFRPKRLSQQPDEARARKALDEDLPPLLDYLESQLNGEFLVGDSLTLADIAVASPFENLAMIGEAVDAGRWPRTRSYLDRMLGRPCFDRARAAAGTVV